MFFPIKFEREVVPTPDGGVTYVWRLHFAWRVLSFSYYCPTAKGRVGMLKDEMLRPGQVIEVSNPDDPRLSRTFLARMQDEETARLYNERYRLGYPLPMVMEPEGVAVTEAPARCSECPDYGICGNCWDLGVRLPWDT